MATSSVLLGSVERRHKRFQCHVVPKTLFAAQANPSGIEQISEELPPGRRLEALLALGRCDAINGAACGHAAGVPVDGVLGEVGNAL